MLRQDSYIKLCSPWAQGPLQRGNGKTVGAREVVYDHMEIGPHKLQGSCSYELRAVMSQVYVFHRSTWYAVGDRTMALKTVKFVFLLIIMVNAYWSTIFL